MFNHYLSAAFLLSTGVGVYSHADKVLLYFNALLIVGGVLTWYFYNRERENRAYKMLMQRFTSMLLTIGILASIWSILREQGVVMLSSHVVILAIYLVLLIWLVTIIKFEATDYQVLVEAQRKEDARQKYLPKKSR
jgi:fatty acid desaturase